jgi:hypothetical protein
MLAAYSNELELHIYIIISITDGVDESTSYSHSTGEMVPIRLNIPMTTDYRIYSAFVTR